ncbi:MAG: hypothetical protein ABWZ55_09265 [Acidimicrobiales bacterium]
MSVGVDVWGDVVGQVRAEADLRAAVAAPLHAYLFVGPPGSGRMAAARAFAAALFTRDTEGEDAERHARLALEGKHPDLIVFEPEGARLSVDMDKGDLPAIIQEVNRAPVEADRKVVVLGQFHTMEQFAGAFLKTIEEPPPRTIIVIVADEIPPELVTTASRCVRIDFGPVPDAAVIERLVAEGVAPDRAQEAAEAASGDLARSRLLATDPDLAARRDAWRAVPDRLDGTGARVIDLVEDLRAGSTPPRRRSTPSTRRNRRPSRSRSTATACAGASSPSSSPGTGARSGPYAVRRSSSGWPPSPAATATPWPTAATRPSSSTASPPSRRRPRTLSATRLRSSSSSACS